VNANTDKDIKAIANGSSLGLGAPGNNIVKYYYGDSSIPAGKYSLKAAPYSGKRGKATAGTPVSVSFTLA
jgi:hypothetical protein